MFADRRHSRCHQCSPPGSSNMTQFDIENSVENTVDSARSAEALGNLLGAAFEAQLDAIYLFDEHRKLLRYNRAAAMLDGASVNSSRGKRCCDMFWRVEENELCVVDRAEETGDRVEVEMLAGANSQQPILLIAQPLGGRAGAGTMVIAR